MEREYIHTDDEIHMYDFMHIRMKPQTTKYVRASATSNSHPMYVSVIIFKNNMMRIFQNSKTAVGPEDRLN